MKLPPPCPLPLPPPPTHWQAADLGRAWQRTGLEGDPRSSTPAHWASPLSLCRCTVAWKNTHTCIRPRPSEALEQADVLTLCFSVTFLLDLSFSLSFSLYFWFIVLFVFGLSLVLIFSLLFLSVTLSYLLYHACRILSTCCNSKYWNEWYLLFSSCGPYLESFLVSCVSFLTK